jgi:hypothetical protein
MLQVALGDELAGRMGGHSSGRYDSSATLAIEYRLLSEDGISVNGTFQGTVNIKGKKQMTTKEILAL